MRVLYHIKSGFSQLPNGFEVYFALATIFTINLKLNKMTSKTEKIQYL